MQRSDNATQARWAVFAWPEWVPDSIRVHIEHLWSTPLAWSRDSIAAGAPVFGADVRLEIAPLVHIPGRYVHVRGLLGRVVSRATPGFVHVVVLHRGQPQRMPAKGVRP